MDELRSFLEEHSVLATVTGGLVVANAGILVYWLHRPKEQVKDYPKDTVILHQIGRAPYAPSLTPFAIKLETYLRMAKIPYENVHDRKRSTKGKFPWISYNGQTVADSAFCIDFINRKRDVDLNSWLTPEQKGIALAFQRLAEDDLYWVLVVQRWVMRQDMDFFRKAFQFSPIKHFYFLVVKFLMAPGCRKMTYYQGMGRHTEEEILHILRKDLIALSDFLGNKPYLMGDRPCEQDCAIFGQMAQLYWQLPGPAGTVFRDEFPNLVSYCERMKSSYWPDWKECTTQGGTTPATR